MKCLACRSRVVPTAAATSAHGIIQSQPARETRICSSHELMLYKGGDMMQHCFSEQAAMLAPEGAASLLLSRGCADFQAHALEGLIGGHQDGVGAAGAGAAWPRTGVQSAHASL